jgi:transposase
MRREHARAIRGSRVVGTKPGRNWKTLSLIGAIRLGRSPCLMTNRGSVNGKIFLRFVRRHLLPTLRPGDVVIMDNLNFHKMKVVREAIEAVGATPLYLPTYSPELNPIELWWGDVKRHLRRLRLDAQDLLENAVRGLRARLSHTKIAGWFRFSLKKAHGK